MRGDELLQHGDGFGGIIGLGVEIRGFQQRLALHLGILMRICCDALEFTRRGPRAIARGIRNRKLARYVRGELALGKLAAEILEHADRPIPLLQVDELRRCIVFGGGADF